MHHDALIEQLDVLRAFLTAHPTLPHPIDVEANSRHYDGIDPTVEVRFHLNTGHEGRCVESIDAITQALGADGWQVYSNSVDQLFGPVEVTVYLPPRDAEPGLAQRLLSLGWTAATQDAL